MSQKIVPFLWFDGQAEEAARFYVTLVPNSRIDNVVRSVTDTPSGPAGMVLVVDFTLDGHRYAALNGGPQFPHSEAVSLQILTDDQAETDRLWDAIVGNGGQESACGWCKDRWGFSWQVTPRRLIELIGDTSDSARARRAMQAMMEMRKIDIAAIERAANAQPQEA